MLHRQGARTKLEFQLNYKKNHPKLVLRRQTPQFPHTEEAILLSQTFALQAVFVCGEDSCPTLLENLATPKDDCLRAS